MMDGSTVTMPLLAVRGLTKRYGSRIGCADVGFELWPGEVLGIVGESGSGKSTLLSCLAGMQRPDDGAILWDGRDVLDFSETERRRLLRGDWAYVHQNPRDGLRMGVSAGGNVGERLMAVGQRHYGAIRDTAAAGAATPATTSTSRSLPSRLPRSRRSGQAPSWTPGTATTRHSRPRAAWAVSSATASA